MSASSEPFGSALRRLRRRAGLTQEQLAERAGLSPRAIRALELGERGQPYPHTVRALAAALGLSDEERVELGETVGPPARRVEFPVATATPVRHGNLPAEVASFVGRRRPLQVVTSAFDASPLVTVVGPGGVGKTRIALRAAADLGEQLPDGAWLVELAGLGDARLVPKAVAAALGMRDHVATREIPMLLRHLAGRRLLLVLDNCEHLLAACADLVDVLLRQAPGVQVLAASRQPLGIECEQVVALPPLALPAVDEQAGGRLARSEAIDLFVQRAAEATGDFQLTAANQRAVLELCRRLDGMPLAIELAAVRLRSLGLEQITARLNDRFVLLVGGNRAGPPRQQTLRATIEWSYDLLDDEEQAVLRRLSVLAGGFGLEAARAVCGVAPACLPGLLGGLVEKSVLARESTPDAARWRLHETMREYARLRLAEAGEEGAAIGDHLAYCRALCWRADGGLISPRLVGWFDRLDLELDDVRVALRRCLQDPAGAEPGLEMVGLLWPYWVCRSVGEGVQWLDRLLQLEGGGDRVRARALFARGQVATRQPDLPTAIASLRESVTLARRADDVDTLVHSLGTLAISQALAFQVEPAQATVHEVGELAAASARPLWLYRAGAADAIAASLRGDFDRARTALDGVMSLGPEMRESMLVAYGHLALGLGLMIADPADPEAGGMLRRALDIYGRLDDRSGIGYALLGVACHAAGMGEPQRFAVLLGAFETIRRQEGTAMMPVFQPLLAGAREQALARLAQHRFEAARAEGALLDRETAIAYALGDQE